MAILALVSLVAFADADLDDVMPNAPIENSTLDIEGEFHHEQIQQVEQQKPTSQADQMKSYRAKLEKQTQDMMKKKIEDIRLKQEMALQKQMIKNLQNTFNKLDNM